MSRSPITLLASTNVVGPGPTFNLDGNLYNLFRFLTTSSDFSDNGNGALVVEIAETTSGPWLTISDGNFGITPSTLYSLGLGLQAVPYIRGRIVTAPQTGTINLNLYFG